MLPFALLAVGAFALVAAPLWRSRRAAPPSTDPVASDVAARRARLRELEDEWHANLIDESAYREARAEVERELLQALEQAERESVEGAPRRPLGSGGAVVVLAAILVPVLAAGIYLQTGAPELLIGGGPAASPQAADSRERLRAGLPNLEQRVRERPQDVGAWTMLIRTYQALERPQEAAAAAARAIEENGDIPALLVERERALAAAGGRFGEEAVGLLERALARAPAYPDALWFRGLAAAQSGDAGTARQHWLALRAQLAGEPQAAERLDDLIAGLPSRGSGAEIERAPLAVTVELEPSLAIDLPEQTTVYVYARDAERGGPPLAAARTTLGQLPARLHLDDAMARATGRALSDAARLEVVARVSASGDPAPAAGDYEGVTTVTPTTAAGHVTVTVDSRR